MDLGGTPLPPFTEKICIQRPPFWEDIKYYFVDFFRKGGVVPPNSVTPFSLKIYSVKGGRGVPPNSVTYFLDQKQVFFGQKTPFLALFEKHFLGECP